MDESFDILPLRPFTQAEIWPLVNGYETDEIYAVEKLESDTHTRFDIRLVKVGSPYQSNFYEDFASEECEYYQRLLATGYSFGAYLGERLIAVALAEALLDDSLLRVWEFHVHESFRRMGIGRALMARVVARAEQDHLKMIKLETQNTNVKAIRFYRSMGFPLEAIDCSEYFNSEGQEAEQVAFYMKRRIREADMGKEANS